MATRMGGGMLTRGAILALSLGRMHEGTPGARRRLPLGLRVGASVVVADVDVLDDATWAVPMVGAMSDEMRERGDNRADDERKQAYEPELGLTQASHRHATGDH